MTFKWEYGKMRAASRVERGRKVVSQNSICENMRIKKPVLLC